MSTNLSLTKTCQWVLLYFCRNTYTVISLKPHGILQSRHTQHVGEACGKCIHKGASHSFPTVSGQIHRSLIKLETGYASMQRSSWRVHCWCDTGTFKQSRTRGSYSTFANMFTGPWVREGYWTTEFDLLLSKPITFSLNQFTQEHVLLKLVVFILCSMMSWGSTNYL